MTTMYPTSDGYFQQDNAPCHKAGIISDWFLEHALSVHTHLELQCLGEQLI